MLQDFGVAGEVLAARDTSVIEALLLEVAEEKPQNVRLLRGRIRFRFPEREAKGGEVPWWDPDVRAWMKRAHERVPHLLYYLHPENPQLLLLFAAFSDIEGIDLELSETERQADTDQFMLSLFSERLLAAAVFAESMADDGLSIVAEYAGFVKPPVGPAVLSAVEASLKAPHEQGSGDDG